MPFYFDAVQEWPRGFGESEKLCVPVAGEGIAALVIDRARGRIYGLSDKTAVLFSYDLESKKVKKYGSMDPLWHFSENLLLAPSGQVLTTAAGNRLVRFDPNTDRITLLEDTVPTFPGRSLYARIDSYVWEPRSRRFFIGDKADGLLYTLDPETLETRLIGKPTDRIRVRALAAAHDGREGIDGVRVELDAGEAMQFGKRILHASRGAVSAAGGHGVEGFRQVDDAGAQRDPFAGQLVGVSRSIEVFVVVADVAQGALELFDGLQDGAGDERVAFDGRAFVGRQGAGLLEDGLFDAEFAEIVEDAGDADAAHFVVGQAHFAGRGRGQCGDVFGMEAGIRVLGLQDLGHDGKHVQEEHFAARRGPAHLALEKALGQQVLHLQAYDARVKGPGDGIVGAFL